MMFTGQPLNSTLQWSLFIQNPLSTHEADVKKVHVSVPLIFSLATTTWDLVNVCQLVQSCNNLELK